MIVYSYYEGDDLDLARRQHDVYDSALSDIVRSCERSIRTACTILDLDVRDFWLTEKRLDHRTLQVVHDILAARWRYLVRPPQGDLFPMLPGMSGWFDWLRSEIDSWVERPVLVAALRRILCYQNSALGYAAEDSLRAGLLQRYDMVPWSSGTAERRQW